VDKGYRARRITAAGLACCAAFQAGLLAWILLAGAAGGWARVTSQTAYWWIGSALLADFVLAMSQLTLRSAQRGAELWRHRYYAALAMLAVMTRAGNSGTPGTRR
jgi:hypothetical protein